MSEQTTAPKPPSRAVTKRLSECQTLQEAFETAEFRDRIAGAIPRHMDPDTMLRAFVQAASKTPLIYRCNLRQSIGAFLSLTYLGLTPGTSLGLAHLIPFRSGRLKPGQTEKDQKFDLNVIIGYHGYIELAFRSGMVRDIQTGVVFAGEHFDHEQGTNKFLIHKRNIDLDTSGLTPRCAYAVATLAAEGHEFEIMPWPEVLSIRNRSQAYRRALAAKNAAEGEGKRPPLTWTEAPWVRDEKQMGRKTAIRRLANILPKCPELRAGVALDEQADRGAKLDFGPIIEGTITPEDGIPEVAEEEDPRDPGSTYGVRETTQQTAPPAQTRAATARTEAKQPDPEPEFETVLVDAFGEIVGEYTDPVQFAAGLSAAYAKAFPLDRGNLLEHNADGIDDARRQSVQARGIIDAMLANKEATPPVESTPASGGMFTQAEPVAVPQINGKPSWPTWSKVVREEMVTINAADALEWIEAQREAMGKAPPPTRIVVAKAMVALLEGHGLTNPDWLSAPKPPAQPAQDAAATQPAQEQAEKPVDVAPPSKDEQRGQEMIRDLGAIAPDVAGRGHFDTMVKLETTRVFMARLRRENVELFNTIREAFEKKNAELPPAPAPLPDQRP